MQQDGRSPQDRNGRLYIACTQLHQIGPDTSPCRDGTLQSEVWAQRCQADICHEARHHLDTQSQAYTRCNLRCW